MQNYDPAVFGDSKEIVVFRYGYDCTLHFRLDPWQFYDFPMENWRRFCRWFIRRNPMNEESFFVLRGWLTDCWEMFRQDMKSGKVYYPEGIKAASAFNKFDRMINVLDVSRETRKGGKHLA